MRNVTLKDLRVNMHIETVLKLIIFSKSTAALGEFVYIEESNGNMTA